MSSDVLLNFGPPFSGARDGVHFSGSCQQAGFQPFFFFFFFFFELSLAASPRSQLKDFKNHRFFSPPKLLRSWNFH